jgi:hypothetical protein
VPSTFTQKLPVSRIFGQLVEVTEGLNVTSGGSSDKDVKDWQVKPTGPAAVCAVTIVTPEQKLPMICRILCGDTSFRSFIVLSSRVSRLSRGHACGA